MNVPFCVPPRRISFDSSFICVSNITDLIKVGNPVINITKKSGEGFSGSGEWE
ncbi:hypothetical protein LP7551_04989 [Roseibium album]|nr:hypothetical protein LP7551_04989 [Roseibium album]